MATVPATATIRRDAGTTEINVRKTPGRSQTNVQSKLAAGSANLAILEVKEDEKGEKGSGDKVYQWFKLRLPDKTEGWVRDDLLDIVGDCTAFGYGVVAKATQAFTLKRNPVIVNPDGGGTPLDPTGEGERVRKLAFNITSTFEGGGENKGYTMYQNDASDAGVVSFGRFQFTLTAGTLGQLLERYFVNASGDTANQLRTTYLERIKKKDRTLRTDETLKGLPQKSGLEQAMAMPRTRWRRMCTGRKPRSGTRSTTFRRRWGKALIFDMMIHHGAGNLDTRYLEWTLTELKSPATWKPGITVSERVQFIARLAQRRRDELYRQAGNRASGLKVRGDFWMTLVQNGDWNLVGDAQGIITPKSGRTVNARNPL
ncbi:MAG: hypothetical protein U0694_12855 [Anaerolineae bacterium]